MRDTLLLGEWPTPLPRLFVYQMFEPVYYALTHVDMHDQSELLVLAERIVELLQMAYLEGVRDGRLDAQKTDVVELEANQAAA